MRTEKCLTCQNYTPQPEDQRSGREWMNSTGWCELPRLHTKRRRIDKDNWCDNYSEKFVPQTMTDLMISPEAIEAADGFGEVTKPSFEHWKLSLREAIWDIKASLDALDTLANTPYEDLE